MGHGLPCSAPTCVSPWFSLALETSDIRSMLPVRSLKMIHRLLKNITPTALSKWLLVILGIAVFITASALVLYFSIFNNGFSHKNEEWGTFGDFFGGTVNPLLSFLSLIALLLTIVLQSKEQERAVVSQENS